MVSSVGKHVKAIREAKSPKLSAQGLADRVSELGYPYSRSQLVNLEYGRKKTFEVTELIAIAEALDVAPVELLFPGLPDGEVEYLPGRTARAIDALLSFTGEGKGAYGERDRHLEMMRALADNQAKVDKLKSKVTELDSDEVSRLAELNRDIEIFRRWLASDGYTIAGPEPKPELTFFGPEVHLPFRDESDDDE